MQPGRGRALIRGVLVDVATSASQRNPGGVRCTIRPYYHEFIRALIEVFQSSPKAPYPQDFPVGHLLPAAWAVLMDLDVAPPERRRLASPAGAPGPASPPRRCAEAIAARRVRARGGLMSVKIPGLMTLVSVLMVYDSVTC